MASICTTLRRLRENAVKSVKRYLLRTIGETRLTYEELCTVLVRVKACLNSQLFHPLSSDPKDLDPLTSGYFFTGSPTINLIYSDVTDVKINRLFRFQLLQAIQQHFWRRWQDEYLYQLQQHPSERIQLK